MSEGQYIGGLTKSDLFALAEMVMLIAAVFATLIFYRSALDAENTRHCTGESPAVIVDNLSPADIRSASRYSALDHQIRYMCRLDGFARDYSRNDWFPATSARGAANFARC